MAFTRVRGPGITTEDNYRVGIITAAKFVGPIETTVDSDFTNVNVTGIGTIDGVKIGNPSGIITASSSSGIVTYYGDASKLTGLTAGQIPNLDGAKITTGTVAAARIDNLDGAKITTGTVAAARIDNLAASKITTGTVATARLGSGTANNTSFLRGDQTWASNTSTTINNNANNKVITGSGTADTLEAEASLTFDAGLLKIDDLGGTAGKGRLEFGNGGEQYIEGFDTGNGGSGSYLAIGSNTDERLRIDNGGRVLIGDTANRVVWGINPTLQVTGTEWDDTCIAIQNFGNNTRRPTLLFTKGKSGTIGNFGTPPAAGEGLGIIGWSAHDTTDADNLAAYIQCFSTSVATANNQYGALSFSTTNGTSTTEKLRITSGGQVLIGETSVAGGSQKLVIGQGGAENFEFTPGSSTLNGGVIEYIHRGDGNTRPDLNMYIAGAGAFKVYTNGNNERLRIDSSGHIHTGYATNVTGADHVNILSADGGGVSVAQNNDGDATSGTTIGSYSFQGYHQGGATFASAEARISAIAAANHTGSSAATDLAFYTKPSTIGPGSAPTERLRIQADGNVGIARTVNNWNTSNTSSLYDLSINRESNNTNGDGLNKSLNVDNQYTVSTFRAPNTNRNGTQAWFDIAHFRAWDINAKVIIQSGGTFTGDQVEIRVISSYNSALGNNRSGPYLEVKSTQAHNARRFTKVKLGCNNSNRQPILQVYLDGNATHNANGYINVTVYDYGSAYGTNAHRGEPKFATATTLNETWKELKIYDGTNDSGTLISDPQGIVLDSVISTGPKTITGGTNLAIQNFKVKGVWSGSPSIGKEIELISGYDSEVKMVSIGYNLTNTTLGSTYGGDLVFHTQPVYGSPTTPIPESMRITSSGYVTKPKTPSFMGRGYNGNSSGRWLFDEVATSTGPHNTGSHFNNSTGIFTCPCAGNYFISGSFGYVASQNYISVGYTYNGTNKITYWSDGRSGRGDKHVTGAFSAVLKCAKGDELAIVSSTSYSFPDTSSQYAVASVYLLG